MAELGEIRLTVEEAAVLLHVQPQTVRRRLRDGELRSAVPVGSGPAEVLLVPAETWLRVEDASALLGVSPATIRSNIARGRLTGRRERNGRWRVQLLSVLEDRRCDPEALARFTGERPSEDDVPVVPARRPHSLHRAVFLRLTEEEAELLERARDRHGTIRAAVVFGLETIDRDDLEVDPAELRAEHGLYREQLERSRAAYAALRERAEGRLVDELRCHVCEAWVPVEECSVVELDDGRIEVFHEKHGHRSGSRFRMDTGLARRAPIDRNHTA